MTPLTIAQADIPLSILSNMANRHGIITGATGTGKTVTLQAMAEQFSSIGVPVFLADIKGDLAGLAQAGGDNTKIADRLKSLGLENRPYESFPVMFWDVFGKQGHPLRTTISDMGPLILSRLLSLNETQSGVLTIAFKIADDNGMLLLDLKDLRALLAYVGDNSRAFTTAYGNISAASIGAIQRGLLSLEQEGGSNIFGEPALNIFDMMQTDPKGRGYINILAANELMHSPRVYATFLLWLMSELFEEMPEAGDLPKPKMVFFFDEAHLLFTDAPSALLEKIEQVVRLIRSKGIGIYFVTQNPLDVPESVLGQLGNRVQHALRSYTPIDQKAVRTAAQTFRTNPKIDTEKAITELGVGEALVSFLEEKGTPAVVERAFIIPPKSHIGTIDNSVRDQLMRTSLVYGQYDKIIDRESAYEKLQAKAEEKLQADKKAAEEKANASKKLTYKEDVVRSVAKSTLRAMGSQLGRQITTQIVRGILGTFLGTKKK